MLHTLIIFLSIFLLVVIIGLSYGLKKLHKSLQAFLIPHSMSSITRSHKNFYFLTQRYERIADEKLEYQLHYLKSAKDLQNDSINSFPDLYSKLISPILISIVTTVITLCVGIATITSKLDGVKVEDVTKVLKDTSDAAFGELYPPLFVLGFFLLILFVILQFFSSSRKELLGFHISIIEYVLKKKEKTSTKIIKDKPRIIRNVD